MGSMKRRGQHEKNGPDKPSNIFDIETYPQRYFTGKYFQLSSDL
jgi:hypothetical protein